MAEENVKLAQLIARLMTGGMARGISFSGADFGPARAPGRDWVVTPNTNPMRPDRVSTMGAAVDLAKEMQEEPMDFDAGVVFIPGPAQNNAGLARTPENLEAFLHQTPEEHEKALTQFADKIDPKTGEPLIPPDKAAKMGKLAEEGLAKWWNDREPRRPVTPTSSCVKKARIGPNGDIYITFGSSDKEYQYEGSSDPVKASEILRDLVASESIGRAVNSWTGDWGRRHTYLPKS